MKNSLTLIYVNRAFSYFPPLQLNIIGLKGKFKHLSASIECTQGFQPGKDSNIGSIGSLAILLCKARFFSCEEYLYIRIKIQCKGKEFVNKKCCILCDLDVNYIQVGVILCCPSRTDKKKLALGLIMDYGENIICSAFCPMKTLHNLMGCLCIGSLGDSYEI